MGSFAGDHFLAELIKAVEVGAMSPNLTLLISGAAVTGYLVPRQEYLDTARKYLQAHPTDARTTAEQLLVTLEALPVSDPPILLYLAYAHIGNQSIGLMRIAIERVDGVSLQSVAPAHRASP